MNTAKPPYMWYVHEPSALVVIGPAEQCGEDKDWHAVEFCWSWNSTMFIRINEGKEIARRSNKWRDYRVMIAVPYDPATAPDDWRKY